MADAGEVVRNAIQDGLERGRDDYLLRKAQQIRTVAKVGYLTEDLDLDEIQALLRLIFDLADVMECHLEVD